MSNLVYLGGTDYSGISGTELSRVIAKIDITRCHFCESKLRKDKNDMYLEEVGEFWSDALQDSVLAHPDCLPLGIDAVLNGEDPEWKMA